MVYYIRIHALRKYACWFRLRFRYSLTASSSANVQKGLKILREPDELKPDKDLHMVPASFDDTERDNIATTASEEPETGIPAEPEEQNTSAEEPHPAVTAEDPAAHAKKLAQIREALSMANPQPEKSPQTAKPGSIPPLRKKGTKKEALKRAAMDTVAAIPPQAVPGTPVKQTASLPPLRKKEQTAAQPASAAPTAVPPLKRVTSPRPVTPPASQAPAPASRPLAPLRRTGTSGTAAAAATATIALPRTPSPAEPAAPRKTQTAAAPAKKAATSRTAKKPRLSVGKICGIFGGAAAGSLVLAYVIIALAYQNSFLPHTSINGVDVSNMTREEAEAALLDAARTPDLVFVTADGENVTFTADSYNAGYTVPETALDEAFGESRWLWVRKLFTSTDYTAELSFYYSKEKLRSSILSYDWGNESSQNAYITMGSDGKYEIVPEVMGDQFDDAVLSDYTETQLDEGTFTIQMLDSGCYAGYEAEIVSEDLTEQLERCNQFASCSITFDFSDRQEIVDGEMIAEWVTIKEDGSYAFNTKSMSEFVAEMANKYDTYGRSRTFQSTLDGTITVPWTEPSIYGWQIDQSATVEQLTELIEAGESVTVAPKYTDWGYGYCRDENDIGNTYIEVDISAQHVWYYKDGVLQLESDCVTGTETDPSRITPRGIFKIWSHESPRKLGTYAVQGYETWVDYWMPINYIGVGLHDLNRSAYGGDIYMYSGSHGCINLPHDVAKELYNTTVNGIPVIIHD